VVSGADYGEFQIVLYDTERRVPGAGAFGALRP
jgi:hypothetical protein